MPKKNKNKIDTTRFREKQLNEFIQCGENLDKMYVKKKCHWKIVNDEILCFMTCADCNIDKERTTENYIATNVNKGIEEWFTRSRSGVENVDKSCIVYIHKFNLNMIV